jgi:hypothetical protein
MLQFILLYFATFFSLYQAKKIVVLMVRALQAVGTFYRGKYIGWLVSCCAELSGFHQEMVREKIINIASHTPSSNIFSPSSILFFNILLPILVFF